MPQRSGSVNMLAFALRRIDKETKYLASKRRRSVLPFMTITVLVALWLVVMLLGGLGGTWVHDDRRWFGGSIEKAVSIVVPAYREAENIEPLTRAVFEALQSEGLGGELIIVDDNSQDGTVEMVKDLSHRGYNIRLIVRTSARGLSSAVLRGFEAAQERVVVVMDADLQHPPESLPDLIMPLVKGQSDFVIGSRYMKGGRIGEWSLARKIISLGASALAWPLGRGMKDPMAGFFAIRKELYEAHQNYVSPIGFKIGLELLVKCKPELPMEIPISFSQRKVGTSKLKLKTQVQYLRQLLSLYWFVSPFTVACGLLVGLVLILWGYRCIIGYSW